MAKTDDNDLMLRYLQEIREDQKTAHEEHRSLRDVVEKLDKKVDLHIQKNQYELKAIHEQDRIQNEQLAEHIDGVRQARRQNELMEQRLRAEVFGQGSPNPETSLLGRVEKLEAPRKWFTFGNKALLKLGGSAAALFGIYRLIELLITLL